MGPLATSVYGAVHALSLTGIGTEHSSNPHYKLLCAVTDTYV